MPSTWLCAGCGNYNNGPQCWRCFMLEPSSEPAAEPELAAWLAPPFPTPTVAVVERDRCHVCHNPTLALVGPATEWSVDPPPSDAALYSLWRCETEGCGAEVKRKADMTRCADPRWAEVIHGTAP